MTNQELSAAIRDLDEQLEEFVRKNAGEWNWNGTLRYRPGTRICFYCGEDLSKLHPQANIFPHMMVTCVSLSNEEGQAGGVAPVVLPSASAERGESREGSLRITEDSCGGAGVMNALPRNGEQRTFTAAGNFSAPEPRQSTKWIGWLLVTFAAYCLGLLVWAIVRAK